MWAAAQFYPSFVYPENFHYNRLSHIKWPAKVDCLTSVVIRAFKMFMLHGSLHLFLSETVLDLFYKSTSTVSVYNF